MRHEIDVEAGVAERREVVDGGLRARENNKCRVARQSGPRLHAHQLDRRLGVERIEIVEIGDVRQDGDRDLDARAGLLRALSRKRKSILGGKKTRAGKKWNEAERLPSRRRSDQLHAAGEQLGIAAELV